MERERSLTAPTPEPYYPDQGDDSPWEEPEKSGWELPEPGTYGFRKQFRQDEARQRQALAGADWTTGQNETIIAALIDLSAS